MVKKSAGEKKPKKLAKEKKGAVKPKKDESEKKRKHHRRVRTYATPIRRLCKALDIPLVNRDALCNVEGAFSHILHGVLKQMERMGGGSKSISMKTTRNAFIGYFQGRGVAEETCRAALESADRALETLAHSNE